jgi:hypothetical protein
MAVSRANAVRVLRCAGLIVLLVCSQCQPEPLNVATPDALPPTDAFGRPLPTGGEGVASDPARPVSQKRAAAAGFGLDDDAEAHAKFARAERASRPALVSGGGEPRRAYDVTSARSATCSPTAASSR